MPVPVALARQRTHLILLLVLGVLLGPPAAHAQRAPVHPAQDPFFAPPADLAFKANGAVLQTRTVASAVPGVTATQVQYRSTDARGVPIAAVTTLLEPAVPWPGPGPRPLISYQIGYDALGAHCNPSYTLRTGDEPELASLLALLQLGYAIAAPDHESQTNAVGAGPLAAHVVLDGIRAVGALPQAAGAPVGLYGYSGGGQAAAWAAEQAPIYAPELDIRGVAAGGVPADPLAVVRATDGTRFAGTGLAFLVGLERQYPELGLTPRLSDAGRRTATEVGSGCSTDYAAAHDGQHLSGLLADPSRDPLARHRAQVVFENVRLGKQPPTMPTYLFHAEADPVVPVAGADGLATAWCGGGARVFYQRDPGGDHHDHRYAAAFGAFRWLAQRLAGARAPDNCGATPAVPLASYCPTPGTVKFRLDRIRGERVRRVSVLQDGRLVSVRRDRAIRRVVVRRLVPGTYAFTVTRVTDSHRRINRYRRTVVCKQRFV